MRSRSFCLFDKGSKVSILELLKYTFLQILTVLPKSDLNINPGFYTEKKNKKNIVCILQLNKLEATKRFPDLFLF